MHTIPQVTLPKPYASGAVLTESGTIVFAGGQFFGGPGILSVAGTVPALEVEVASGTYNFVMYLGD